MFGHLDISYVLMVAYLLTYRLLLVFLYVYIISKKIYITNLEDMSMVNLTISQLAKEVRVKPATIRYYERYGLIAPATRSLSGYRQYSFSDIWRMRFIKKAKQMGFTLKEIGELLKLQSNSRNECDIVKLATMEKVAAIQRQMKELEKMKSTLSKLYEGCPGKGSLTDCPILKELGSYIRKGI